MKLEPIPIRCPLRGLKGIRKFGGGPHKDLKKERLKRACRAPIKAE